MGSAEEFPYLVAAIDLGTTHSSYAFSYRHDCQKDPLNITTPVWPGNMDLYTPKTPTVVLLDENLQFVAFGYEAEDIYADKATDQEHENYRLFQHFTLPLCNPNLEVSSDWMILDTHDNEAPALLVYTEVIKYFQKHLQNALVNHTGHDETHKVRWVITIPATWNETAREFLLAAAQESGLEDEFIFITDTSEMVLLYSRHLKQEKLTLDTGKRVMVVDLGGGGVETTGYLIHSDKEVEMFHKQYHTCLGSRILNDLLMIFLSDIFSVESDDLESEIKTNFTDYIDLLRNFEAIKRFVGDGSSKAVTLKLPLSFGQHIKNLTERTLEEIVAETNLDSSISLVKGNLRISREILNMLFIELVNEIINIVSKIEDDFNDSNSTVTHILIAGGFSECQLLQNEIARRNQKVRQMKDSGIAPLKGAVIYGHDPDSIMCLNTMDNTEYSFDEFIELSGAGSEPDESDEALASLHSVLKLGLKSLQENYEDDYRRLCEQSSLDSDEDNTSASGEQLESENELQKEAEEEAERLLEAELQNQHELELQREREAELQRQQEEEQQRLLEVQRQREAEEQKKRELELQRQREAEQQKQRELELQRQREAEEQRKRELELQRQREAEEQKKRELELQRQREAEQQKQRELELQRQREAVRNRPRSREAARNRPPPKKKSSVCVIL